jgi:hypothetical protein
LVIPSSAFNKVSRPFVFVFNPPRNPNCQATLFGAVVILNLSKLIILGITIGRFPINEKTSSAE